MKPHKHARVALKALHQAGQEKKRIKRIIPDISSAIEKISDIKVKASFLEYFVICGTFRAVDILFKLD